MLIFTLWIIIKKVFWKSSFPSSISFSDEETG